MSDTTITKVKNMAGIRIGGIDYLFDNKTSSAKIAELDEAVEDYKNQMAIAEGALFGGTFAKDDKTVTDITNLSANLLLKMIGDYQTTETNGAKSVGEYLEYGLFYIKDGEGAQITQVIETTTETQTNEEETITIETPITIGSIDTYNEIYNYYEGTSYSVTVPTDLSELTFDSSSNPKTFIFKNSDIVYHIIDNKDTTYFCYKTQVNDEYKINGAFTDFIKKFYNYGKDIKSTEINELLSDFISYINYDSNTSNIIVPTAQTTEGKVTGWLFKGKDVDVTKITESAYDIKEDTSLYHFLMNQLYIYFIVLNKYITELCAPIATAAKDGIDTSKLNYLLNANVVSTAVTRAEYFNSLNCISLFNILQNADNLENVSDVLNNLVKATGSVDSYSLEAATDLINQIRSENLDSDIIANATAAIAALAESQTTEYAEALEW